MVGLLGGGGMGGVGGEVGWYFNFPTSTDEIYFFDEISSSGNIFDIMKGLKDEHQNIFPFG